MDYRVIFTLPLLPAPPPIPLLIQLLTCVLGYHPHPMRRLSLSFSRTRTALRKLPPRPRATASLLEVGDEVHVTNLWETLTYKVTSIKVIRPDDINEILIQIGSDMLTLPICHPTPPGANTDMWSTVTA